MVEMLMVDQRCRAVLAVLRLLPVLGSTNRTARPTGAALDPQPSHVTVETGNVWADTGTPDPAAVMRRLAWRFGEEPDLGRRRDRPRGYRVAMADDARRAARSVGGLIVLSGWYVALVPVLGHVIPPLRTASAEDRDIAWRTCRVTKSVQCGLAQMDLQLTGVAVLVLAVAAALLLVLSAAISLLAFVLLFRAGVRSPVVVGTGSAFAGWLATAALGGLAVLAVWH